MKFRILFFCFICFFCRAEDNRAPLIASLENSPTAIIDGKVNAITGDVIESTLDLVVPGGEVLYLQHFFSRPQREEVLFSSWRTNFNCTAERKYYPIVNKHDVYHTSRYLVREGPSAFYYYGSGNRYNIDRSLFGKGITNLGRGDPSARTNLRNHYVLLDKPKGDSDNTCTLMDGSGMIKKFDFNGDLSWVRRTNGFVENYRFLGKGRSEVALKTKNNRHVAAIHIEENYSVRDNPTVTYTADGNHSAKYCFQLLKRMSKEDKRVRYHIQEIHRSNGAPIWFDYEQPTRGHGERLRRVTYPGDRFWEFGYYGSGKTNCGYSQYLGKDYTLTIDSQDHFNGNVQELRQPVGQNAAPVKTHRFVYFHGFTEVYDVYNRLTTYHYCGDFMFKKAVFWSGDSPSTYREELCDEQILGEKYDSGNVKARLIYTPDHKLEKAVHYDYDIKGNVLKKTIWNNLSGHSLNVATFSKIGAPSSQGAECYEKRYTYTEDRFNLVKSEKLPNGVETQKKYLFDTDLLTSELVLDNGRIVKRYFKEYDSDGFLIEEIKDDGSSPDKSSLEGVSTRLITRITPMLTSPVGLPHVIDRLGFDVQTKEERLISSTIYRYYPSGLKSEEGHFGSDGEHRYTLYYKYDDYGNCTYETTPTGEVIERGFDLYGNPYWEKGPHPERHVDYTHDCMNRCIKEVGNFGMVTCHHFNLLSERVETVDPFGHMTHFRYDRYGRMSERFSPQFVDINGSLIASNTKWEYDIFSRVTKEIDGFGRVKETSYNHYDKPALIHYPDGSVEKNIYNLDGTLKEAVDRNGMRTLYEYDNFERPLVKRILSRDGEELSVEKFRYKGDNLISYIDPEGVETNYEYDFAGRQSVIITGDYKVILEFDIGAYLFRKSHFKKDQLLAAYVTKRDVLGRIIEEWVEDDVKRLVKTYKYDYVGNCILETLGDQVTSRKFDVLSRLTEETDPQGFVTRYFYDHEFVNHAGQRVLQVRCVDPNGNSTFTTYDTNARVSVVEKRSSVGVTLSLRRHVYDRLGQCIETTDEVIGRKDAPQVVRFDYDVMGQLTVRREGNQVTYISYNTFGKKYMLTKPDGTQIWHHYDAKGRLYKLSTSDRSIRYTYEYDKKDRLIYVHDQINHQMTTRNYNIYDQLESETLGNGLTLLYTYDGLNRPLTITYPDGSCARYSYNSFTMTRVERLDAQGSVLYEQTYDSFDEAGHTLQYTLLGHCGQVKRAYNPCGRIESIKHLHYAASNINYDPAGNLTGFEENGQVRTFSYDPLHQLTLEEGAIRFSYAYDSLYNRTSKNGKDYEIGPHNTLMSDGDHAYSFDLNGNMKKKWSEATYDYDALNRLISVTANGQTTRYQYDYLGRRLARFHPDGSKELFLYEDEREIGKVEQGRITELRLLGIGRGAEIGASVAIELNGQIFAPLHDLNGSIVALLTPDGALDASTSYSAFGEATNPFVCPWTYSSKRQDPESKLIFFGHRYYDPLIGRWTTCDPLATTPPCNLYTYAMNGPLTQYDLYGLFSMADVLCVNRYTCELAMTAIRDTYRNLSFETACRYGSFIHGSTIGMMAYWCFMGEVAFDEPECYKVGVFRQNETISINLMNGIFNFRKDGLKGAEALSNNLGGVEINWTHNPTGTPVPDLLRCANELYSKGFTKSVFAKMEQWKEQLKDPTAKTIDYCFSEGAIIVRNALMYMPKETRDRIFVIAIGPAAYIESRLCGGVEHICSRLDPVTYFDIAGRSKCADTIRIVDQLPNDPIHEFVSRTYQNEVPGAHRRMYKKATGVDL